MRSVTERPAETRKAVLTSPASWNTAAAMSGPTKLPRRLSPATAESVRPRTAAGTVMVIQDCLANWKTDAPAPIRATPTRNTPIPVAK